MSIIIRLQNLPWEANSQDIRRFFVNLSIPEGGVHIVGGDKGDAFIAFSSDEDARQAMARDGQEIKGIRVKLFLSSKAEMAKTVEQARQAHLALTAKPPVVVPAPVMKEESNPSGSPQSNRRRSRSRSKERRRSRSRDRRRRSKSPSFRKRPRSNDRNKGPNRNRGRRSRSPSDTRSRFDRGNGQGKTEIFPSENSKETPIWEPGMQPGGIPSGGLPLSLAVNAIPPPFIGMPPAQVTAGLSNLLQGIQGGLPVNPLIVAQALVQNGLQENAGIPKALDPLLKLASLNPLAALEGPLLPTPDNSTNGDTPPSLPKPMFPMRQNSSHMNGNGYMKPPFFKVSGFTELPNFFDVKHFFFGLLVRDGCIKFSWEGMRPVLFISMEDEEDARTVEQMNGELYANYYPLRIERIDHQEFIKNQDFYPNTPHQSEPLRFVPIGRGPELGGRARPNENDLIVAVIDVPLGVNEMQIRDLFSPIRCSQVIVDIRRGQPKGFAFVKFDYHSDFEQALERGGSFLHTTKVEILPVSQRIFDEAKRRCGLTDGQTRVQKKSRFSNADESPVAQPERRSEVDAAKTVLSVENLPFDVVDRQLGEFCANFGVICQSIHIKNGNNPMEKSRAFVECPSAADAATMAAKTGTEFYGSKLKILAVTPVFMRTMMGGGAPTPTPLAPPPFGMSMMRPPFEMSGMPSGPFRGRDRPMGPRGGGRGMMAGSTGSMVGPHQNGPSPPVGGNPFNEAPQMNANGGDPFSNPLCVVAICNLNYTAGVDDLISVFKDYNIRKDLIMRRYNDQNQPTGDARVAFASPKDAAEAVQRFNGTQLLGRTLRLSLLGR